MTGTSRGTTTAATTTGGDDGGRSTGSRAWAVRLAGATVLLALVAGACSKTDTAAPTASPGTTEKVAPANTSGPADDATPTDGGQLVMGLEGEPEGLDPTRFAYAAAGHFISSAVFEPLATVDEKGNAVPYLATAITPNSDYTVWTITLPDGVTFHDGTKLDSAAVKANLDAHRNSIITKLAMQTVTDVQAPDAKNVVVTLNKPWVRFPNLLTSQLGYVLAPAMLADGDLAKKPIGTGPFVFDSHADGAYWKFKKNASYRQKGLPHLDGIEFKILIDEGARTAALTKGDVDMIHTSKPEQVQTIKGTPDLKLVSYSQGEEDFIILNTIAPPFDNLTARQAVAYATDTAGWLKDRTRGVEQPANSPFAPGQLGYEADNGFPTFDMAKAKALVAQYEKEAGKPLEFTYTVSEGLDNTADAQYFQQRYEEAGMKVTIVTYRQIQLVGQVAVGNFQLSQFRNFGFHDPDTDATFFRSASALDPGGVSLNFPHFRDPVVDEQLDKALASTTDADRDAAYRKLQREFAEKLPYIWMGRPEWVLAANERVNGIYPAANGSLQTLGGKTWLTSVWVSR